MLRAEWPELSITGRELRAVYETEGPTFDEDALDRIDEANRSDQPSSEKWRED